VHEALRGAAFHERCKIHDIIMQGIDTALKKRGYPSIDDLKTGRKAATAFLFKLISQLQLSGTVPMIDVQAYAQWLLK
jgi:hypothetical protein